MEIRVPHYYRKFRCTADKCPDTCCAGWQIVIDEETLEKLEILRRGVECGIVTEEEFQRIKKAYETCRRESFIIQKYEEKYGLVDEIDDDGIILIGSFETTLDEEDD